MSDINKIAEWTGDGDADVWPYPTEFIKSSVTGELRDKILSKTGMVGDVEILEEVISGGWSSWTQETDYSIVVTVDGARVFERDYQWSQESALKVFLEWIDA